MKRIVFLTKSTMRYDSRVKKISSSLAKNNYKVTVIAEKLYVDLKKNEYTDFSIYRVHTLSGFYSLEASVSRVSKQITTNTNLSYKFLMFIKHIKFRIYIVKTLNRILWNTGALFKTIRLKPDLIISRDPDTLLTAFLASKIINKPLVYEPHELWDSSNLYLHSSLFMQKYWNYIERTLIKKVDLTFTTTQSKLNILVKKYGVKNIHVLRSTYPYKEINHSVNLREEYHISQDKIVLIYQGQIDKIRGVFDLVEVMKDLDKFVLILMGMGNEINTLLHYITSCNLNNKIYFRDAVSPDKIIENIASADIGIQPFHYSENIYNEISNKLLECIMAELPCIGVNFPEISKIIKENNIGFVYESGNINQLKNILKSIEKNRDMLVHFKENCKKIKKNYAWETDEEVLLNEIRKLL